MAILLPVVSIVANNVNTYCINYWLSFANKTLEGMLRNHLAAEDKRSLLRCTKPARDQAAGNNLFYLKAFWTTQCSIKHWAWTIKTDAVWQICLSLAQFQDLHT